MVKQKFIGINPFSYQKDVIDELKTASGTGKTVVVKSRRQLGKSTLISNLLLFYSINYAGTKNYCLSPTLKQAKNIYKSIINAISQSKIIKQKNATELSIVLINGSSIQFKSAEQRESLRGETCTGILCIDEAAYIEDYIFEIVTPWCDFHNSPKLIVSTPYIKSGFFFRYYQYGKQHEYNTVTIDWSSEKYIEDLNKILPKEKLEEYRKILPKNTFKSEYLGEFLDDDGTVFTGFNSCVRKNEIKPTDKLYIGIDWATGNGNGENDDTVISVLNQYGQQVYLDYFSNLSTTKQLDRLEQFMVKYKKQIVVVQTELNSLGTPMTDVLKERSQLQTIKDKFIGFTTTNSSKNAIVTNLQLAFENRNIEILDNDKQLAELSYYSAEYNIKTRNVSYNAPQGLHDDICIALMLSYDAFKNGNKMGKYCLG